MNKQDAIDLFNGNLSLLEKLKDVEELDDISFDIQESQYQLDNVDEFWEKSEDSHKTILMDSLRNLNKVYITYCNQYDKI